MFHYYSTPAQEEKCNINDVLNPTVTYCVDAKQKLRNIFHKELTKSKSSKYDVKLDCLLATCFCQITISLYYQATKIQNRLDCIIQKRFHSMEFRVAVLYSGTY